MTSYTYYAVVVIVLALEIPVPSNSDGTTEAEKPSEKKQNDPKVLKLPKRQVKCDMKKNQLTVKPNLAETPLDDICWFCTKDRCGRLATDLNLRKPSGKCLSEKIKDCCPNIISIEMEDKELCDCYCDRMEYIRGSGSNGFTKCDKCKQYPPNYEIILQKSKATLISEEKKEQSAVHWQGVQITLLSISIPAVLLLLLGVYCIKFRARQGITLFRNRNAGQQESAQRPYTDAIDHQSPTFRSLDAESLLTTTAPLLSSERETPLQSAGRERSASVLLEIPSGHHSLALIDIENDAAERQHAANFPPLTENANRQQNLHHEDLLIDFVPENTAVNRINEENDLDLLLNRASATAAN